MNIIFDLFYAQPIGKSKFHGGGEYIKTVFRNLVLENKGKNKISVYYNKERFLDAWIYTLVKTYKIDVYDVKNMQDIEKILLYEKFDVLYTGMPYKYAEIDLPAATKKIGTFHGLRFAEKYSPSANK